jgi:hypothetical protein
VLNYRVDCPKSMNRALKFQFILILCTIAFIATPLVHADFQFSSDSTSMTSDSELQVSVNLALSGQGNKNYYLEGAFKKEGGSNYFGLSQKDGNWVSYTSSNFSSLPEVTTDADGNWSGSLKLKLDTGSSNFAGDGNYILQIKRFTEGGSSSFSDNQFQITVTGSPSIPSASPASSSSPQAPSTANPKLSFSFTGLPASTNSDQSFSIQVNLSGDKPSSEIYLKGAFFKGGSTNYFGKTFVLGSWIKNSATYSSQQKITTDGSGNWSGSIQIMPDSEDSGFTGTGDYSFKMAKYTSSGSGPTWSEVQSIHINYVATPEPAATTDPTSTPQERVLGASSIVDSADLLSGDLIADDEMFAAPNLESSQSATPAAFIKTYPTDGSDNWWIVAVGVSILAIGSIPLAKEVKSREWFNTILTQLRRLKKSPHHLLSILSKNAQ